MRPLFAALVAASLWAGCRHEPGLEARAPGGGAGTAAPLDPAIDARLRKLEADNAKYHEMLEWLSRMYAQQKAAQAADEANEPAPDAMFAIDIADDVAAGQVDGPPGACVTIVKAWDFACPYCARVSPQLEGLVQAYQGKLRVVYKNMIIHPVARQAHLAGCAAAKQGKFAEFRHAWWDDAFAPYAAERDPDKLGTASILAIADKLHLDRARFEKDMASDDCKAHVQADITELEKWHVNATPTFFIDGRPFQWDGTAESFKPAIDAELQRVAASGVRCDRYYRDVVMTKGEKTFRAKNAGPRR